MSVTDQKELSPQLLRLLFWAGIIDRPTMETAAKKFDGGKTFIDVMSQEVSLDTFKDLLFSEVSFKRKRGGAKLETELHKGLSTWGMINDQELQHLLAINRPPIGALLGPLKEDNLIDPELSRRIEQKFEADGASIYEALVADRVLNAEKVCQWLGRPESRQMQRAALLMTLHLFSFNKILDAAETQALGHRAQAGELDAVRKRLQNEPSLKAEALDEFLESDLRLPQVSLVSAEIAPELMDAAPQSLIRRSLFIPYYREGDTLNIATTDPLNISLIALLQWTTGLWPQAAFAPAGEIIGKINNNYGPQRPAEPARSPQAPPLVREARPERPVETRATPSFQEIRRDGNMFADNVSAVQLVSSLIESAIDLRTTDIHLEPIRDGLAIRFRIDGDLRRIMTVPATLSQPVVSRIKVLADMDVTERRRPQDGHFELNLGKQNFDFRISTLPASQGEKVVVRILDSQRVLTSMEDLGFLKAQREDFEWMLERPWGMILVTGPTGSGKTSTLYSGLNRLNSPNRNLVTIEDPVEYQLEGITQVQVDSNIGMSFADGLRSILRQDPDVIMVGEIRDKETAQIAIRAAMTGHVVLSTLHTNTALGAIDALTNLGVIRFMLAASLVGILSQRLLRVLCENCKKNAKLTPELREEFGIGNDKRKTIKKPEGCEECLKTGYLGRTGVFEVIRVTDKLRPLFADHHRMEEIEKAAREEGMMGLQQAAMEKVLSGVTSVDEVRRKVLIEF